MTREIAYANREEWLALRKNYIGGSDAAATVGLNPYKSAYTLWAEKTGRISEFSGNLTTEVGSYLEEFVAKLFERQTGKKVRRKNRMLVNDEYPFACADIDRMVVGENSILEIKTTNSLPAMKKLRGGEYPEIYYCQMVHYLAVGGFSKAYLAVLIGGRDFRIFELERDEDEIRALMSAEAEFWEKVRTDTPPATDGTESTSDTLSAVYPTSNGETVNLSPYESLINQYMALTGQIKALERLRDEAANMVKLHLGEASGGESGRYRVSWTSSVRRTFDSKRFAADHPMTDLSGYYRESPTRSFRVTEKTN